MKRQIGLAAAAAALALAIAAPGALACENCKHKDKSGSHKLATSPEKTDAAAESIIKPYLALRASLGADKLDGVAANASAIVKAVEAGEAQAKKAKKPAAYTSSLAEIKKAAKTLSGKAKNIDSARAAFATLSDAVIGYARANVSASDASKYQLYYCDMAKHSWLQKSGEKTGNPYYGKSMAACGEKKSLSSPDADHEECEGMKKSGGHKMHSH